MNKMKHNLNEEYLNSLTEEERIRQMSEWTIEEQEQYFCPNGTITLNEFKNLLIQKVDELIYEKYGSDFNE